MNRIKILQKILAGSKNIRFSDMENLVRGFGFTLSRTDGSHHIFTRPDIPELVSLQNVKGQVRHNLKLEENK
jgi:predicted RNA binding protein YcfA (HicA-like mRNA interferase family)